MIVGVYGTIPFSAGSMRTQTFYDQRRTYKAGWKAHEIHLQKPVGEYVGPGLIEVSFSMNLSTRWGFNPNLMLNQLHKYHEEPRAAALFISGRPAAPGLGMFVITEMDEAHNFYSRLGNVIGVTVGVKLTEYQARMPGLYERIF